MICQLAGILQPGEHPGPSDEASIPEGGIPIKIRKILTELLFWCIIIAVLGSAFLFAINPSAEKTIFGFRAYQVLSGSMAPALNVGDLVVVKSTPPEEIQKGDIITYYPNSSSATVTHRVIGTMLEGDQVVLETRGDAVAQPDPRIYGSSVIGVVAFRIPYLGAAIGWVQDHTLLSILMVGLTVALITSLRLLFRKNENNEEGETT